MDDPTVGIEGQSRFWTYSNAAEAVSEVLSPLCWSVWIPGSERATRRTFHALGILPASELGLPDDPADYTLASFYGRMAINVDWLRATFGGLPGGSGDDMERDLTGTVRPDAPPSPSLAHRLPIVLVKAPLSVVAAPWRVRALYAEQRAWWERVVLPDASQPDPQARLLEAGQRFEDAMALHTVMRAFSRTFNRLVQGLADKVGRPELAETMSAGIGDVAETRIATDVWQLGRGRTSVEAVVRAHGFHGRHEGNVTGTSWREDSGPLLRLAEAAKARADEESPARREDAAVAARAAALAAIEAGLSPMRRPLARIAARLATTFVRHQELTKASYLMAIDGVRKAAADRGRELVDAGVLDDAHDASFLTLDELTGALPANPRETCRARRVNRDEHEAMELPISFTGMPQPLEAVTDVATGAILTGAAGTPGTVEGPARVAADASAASELLDGEILVCRLTDPSWAVAMSLSAGLVTDLGTAASHGAIVARELGLPCVVGVTGATSRIKTGDIIRVDGASTTVEILQPA